MASLLSGKRVRLLFLISSLVLTFFVASFAINLYFYTSTFIVSKLVAPQIDIGVSVSAFTLGVIIFSAVGGVGFNKVSIKAIILSSLAIFTVGSVLTGYATNVPELLLFRFLVGMGTGMLQGTVMGLLGTAYPEKRGLLLSLTGIAFSLGLLFGPYSEALIAPRYLQSYIISGILGAVSIIMVASSLPNVYNGLADGQHVSRKSIFNRNTSMVFLGIFAYGIGYFGFIGYFSNFLIDYLHTAQYVSALTSSALGIGGLFFTLPIGYASDRVGRKTVLLILYGILAITSAIIFGIPITDILMIAVSFVFGAAYNGLIIVIAAAAQDYASKGSVGTASGLVFTFYYAGGIIGGVLFGSMLTFENYRITGIAAVTAFMIIGFITSALITRDRRDVIPTVAGESA